MLHHVAHYLLAEHDEDEVYEGDLADQGLTDGIVWVDGAILADDEIEAEAALETLNARVRS